MKANSSAVVQTLSDIEFDVEAFDPWRASWDSVEAFYYSVGIDVSGLSSREPKKHRIEVPEKYFRTGISSGERSVPLHRVNRPNQLAPNDERLIALKRRVLRMWAILILHRKASLKAQL